jgi:hypothetical protein
LSHSSSSNQFAAGKNTADSKTKSNMWGPTIEFSSSNSNRSNKGKITKLSGKSVNTISFHSDEGNKDITPEKAKKTSKPNTASGKLLDYLCTPKGCRYFQSYVLKASPEVIDQMIKKLSTSFHIVMTNSYANYFFQKFITCCNQDQRKIILTHISGSFLYIASDNSGTHALQAMFEQITSAEEINIISEGIKDDFVHICKVIHKIINIGSQFKSHSAKTNFACVWTQETCH